MVMVVGAGAFDGKGLLSSLEGWIALGAERVVLAATPFTTIDGAGLEVLAAASFRLGRGRLRIAGLGDVGRAQLRSRGLEAIALYEWWTDAVDAIAA